MLCVCMLAHIFSINAWTFVYRELVARNSNKKTKTKTKTKKQTRFTGFLVVIIIHSSDKEKIHFWKLITVKETSKSYLPLIIFLLGYNLFWNNSQYLMKQQLSVKQNSVMWNHCCFCVFCHRAATRRKPGLRTRRTKLLPADFQIFSYKVCCYCFCVMVVFALVMSYIKDYQSTSSLL